MHDIYANPVLVLDYGSQYTQLIARCVRELGVYCQVLPGTVEMEVISSHHPHAIILSGGPQSVTAEGSPKIPDGIFSMGIPVLGVCYGMQAMMQHLGGSVVSSGAPEYGPATVEVLDDAGLFNGIEDRLSENGASLLDVWMSHGDHVSSLADGFVAVAKTSGTPYAAVADRTRRFYGIQFHPEVTHTPQGKRLLSQFLFDVCGCQPTWKMDRIIDEQIRKIQETVGDDRVFVALSGGVDSSVVAALMHRAIGDRLSCLFVDTGLLRYQERDQVERVFVKHFGIDLQVIDASDSFYSALSGIDDPEEKRRVIGHEFIRVFESAAAQRAGHVRWLAQGTIYPDVIESAAAGSGHSEVIKSHHNVGGLPEEMAFELIEPIRELFKDEVRAMGLALGLPADLIARHPFPGPGLGVRIMGEVTPTYASILAQADHCFLSVLRSHGWYDRVSQAFAVFLPVKSVGVKGDARHYGYVISLRAVVTVDFMTADWAELPADLLQEAAHRIIADVPQVARVVYDITSKPPGTIEWE